MKIEDKVEAVLFFTAVIIFLFFLYLGLYYAAHSVYEERKEFLQYLDTPECNPPSCIKSF